jgi:hypothetical protein
MGNPMAMSTRQFIALAVSAIIVICSVVLLPLLVRILSGEDKTAGFRPDIVLPILILAGVVIFIAAFLIAVATFASFGLADRTQAFGMPEGTIRAVIALMLVIILAIVAVFLYVQLRDVPATELIKGLSRAQFNALEATTIVSSEQRGETFDVRLRTNRQASEDFAKQFLTAAITLVTAVAAFYFGSTSVEAARGAPRVSAPLLRRVVPEFLTQGQTNQTLEISGKNLQIPRTMKFTRGADEIRCNDIQASETKITCTVDIPATQAQGKYSLVVVNADGGEDTLTDAFEVR